MEHIYTQMERPKDEAEYVRKKLVTDGNPTYQESDSEEEKKSKMITKTQYTFSSQGMYSFWTTSYVLQEFALNQRHLVTHNKYTQEYEYDYKKYKEIIIVGDIVFEWNGNLYNIEIYSDQCRNTLKSDTDVSDLVQLLKDKIRYENPLRGKLFQIKQARDGFFLL